MANISKYPLVSYQPFRLLYKLAALTSIIAHLPFWIVMGLVPRLRPNRNWSPIQTVMARFLRASLHMDSVIGLGEAETESLTPPKGEGDRFVVVQPFDASVYTGPLASDPSSVSPAGVGGIWRPGPPPPPSEAATNLKRVVLHIHGGAFVRDHPSTPASGFLSRTLLAHAGVDAVFSPRYRLSGHGGRNPFPAAVQDALTAYLYLVRGLGLPPSAVTLSGDSAGGNIAVALLRYLSEFGAQIGVSPPGRAVLIAPWVAPASCFPRRPVGELRVEQMAHYGSDILPSSFLQWGVKTYAPGGDVEATRDNAYIQALGHPFRAGVPVLVSVGEAEILSTDGAAWAREMSGYEGGGVNSVEVYFEENAPHDTLLIGDALKWEDSARRVAARIGEFIEKN
ncbi:alpha/beta hydrolase fold-3 domain-containing protein [Diaporthe sp. PMI_573]|nr:alpha/beta hydrolase fold-3 domain-containing protein [Diaporthaceae sp. PMI_573]